tara:strand:- start:3454 stop:3639 length:186 start_codon:yes stop_codon:yes gene_type:complete
MANQRKEGVKQITHFDWEHNVSKLRKIAERRGISLSELLRLMTKEVVEKYGESYKDYNEPN